MKIVFINSIRIIAHHQGLAYIFCIAELQDEKSRDVGVCITKEWDMEYVKRDSPEAKLILERVEFPER